MINESGHILVVDDYPTNRLKLSLGLKKQGHTVAEAESGRQALDMLCAGSFDLVLLDIMMPEMDGYETMQVIRQNPALHRLPIVALTAKAMKGDRERCLEAGASEYLAKPVNTEQLLSALRMWLHR
jgi:CheY-like chemotaxis protein